MVSAACIGETCWCGQPAAKKVGEEILFDDPQPNRHNLTRYICAQHYAQLMGPLGAKQVGVEPIAATEIEHLQSQLNAATEALDRFGSHKHWCKKWTNAARMTCECGWSEKRRELDALKTVEGMG